MARSSVEVASGAAAPYDGIHQLVGATIGLSGDADIKTRKPRQTGVVNGWRCRYDLQTGKFDVPPLFSNDNARAVVPQ